MGWWDDEMMDLKTLPLFSCWWALRRAEGRWSAMALHPLERIIWPVASLESGITGEPIETYIFCPLVSHSLQVRDGETLLQKVFSKPESSESHPWCTSPGGPIYYQKLKHMVVDRASAHLTQEIQHLPLESFDWTDDVSSSVTLSILSLGVWYCLIL